MNWSPLKTQRLVMKYKGCIEPHEPFEIFFGGQSIIPLESTAESLGLLISKNCIFGAHIKRITDRIKSITCNIRRNFANRNPEILIKVYNTYIQTRVDYCSQVYYPGKESLIRSIESAVRSFWKLGTNGKPPENIMSPSLRLIFTDLVFVHKIVHVNSMIKYEDIFKIKQNINPKVLEEQLIFRDKKMVIPKYRLQIARYRFSFRTRRYWNSVPKELKVLKLEKFKTELKKHILSKKQKFLNLGLDYNVVGEIVEKKKRKKNGQKRSLQKVKKWLRPKKENRLGVNLVGKKRCLNPVAEKINTKITKKRLNPVVEKTKKKQEKS